MTSIYCQLHLIISQHDFAHIIIPLCGLSYVLTKRMCICMYVYNVSQKIPPYGFLNFFPNGWEFLINLLHTYYTIISTLQYKFLFKYL